MTSSVILSSFFLSRTMTGCSVKDCHNRTEEGFSCVRFPKDPTRRALWSQRCGRGVTWIAPRSAQICQVCTVQYSQKKYHKKPHCKCPDRFNSFKIVLRSISHLLIGRRMLRRRRLCSAFVRRSQASMQARNQKLSQ